MRRADQRPVRGCRVPAPDGQSGSEHHGDDEGVCLYLDGLSRDLHGDPERARNDQVIRSWLRNNGYEVIEIAVSDLDDPAAMTRHFKRLANLLRRDDVRERLRTDEKWFQGATPSAARASVQRFSLRLVHPAPEERYVGCLPVPRSPATLGAMRALVAEGAGKVSLVELPDPVPGPGEAVVRVRAALTCGTDLEFLERGHPKVPFPVTLGHEFAGEVESVGEGVPFRPGERVTSTVTAPCGACPECRAGRENLCASAFDAPLFGAYAERLLVPARIVRQGLRRVPENVSDGAAALLDPLASVIRGISRLALGSRATVLVAGAGPIALMFTSLLRLQGARVLVLGRRPARVAILSAYGAEALDPAGGIEEQVRAMTDGRGVDAAIDAAGDPELVASLARLVARGGTLLLFSGMSREVVLRIAASRVHYDEVDVIGSFHYRPSDASDALALIASGALPCAALVDGAQPLGAWREAFDRHAAGEGMKTVLLP